MNDERRKTALGLPLTGETEPLPAGVLDRCMTALNERDKAMDERAARCTKVRRLVDVTVEVDKPSHVGWWERRNGDLDGYAKQLESWAKDFEAFVRDHRSQDPVSLSVNKVYRDQCTVCGAEWDEVFDDDDGKHHCGNCYAEVEAIR